MNKVLLLSSILCTMLLSSCGFLLSPVGEELVVDASEEVVKIEEELVKPKPDLEVKTGDPKSEIKGKTE